MFTSEEIKDIVNKEIGAVAVGREPDGLYAPIRYVLSLGGKRVRPVLLLMAYNLFEDNVMNVMNQALAIEVYHNYTLLHDDLMDRADMRRGNPTVHRMWNDNTAILSGDSMLVLAYKLMADCPNKEAIGNVLALFSDTALEIGEGQQYDMDFEKRMDVTEEEYIEMIRLKTSVLLACALKIGAMAGGATPEDADRLYMFGERLGLAFQLQDDYLDVYGDPKIFGKNIGGDILCNKKTYMLINAFVHADDNQRKELERWMEVESCEPMEKIRVVTELYNQIGIKELCRERINRYFREAEQALEAVGLPEEKKTVLRDYAHSLLGREY
ncbi:MAG: polyprenyl synthetase family protein [Clostridium sp.]|nr:polyprenyl synthetase family protein [Clostridium sp.]